MTKIKLTKSSLDNLSERDMDTIYWDNTLPEFGARGIDPGADHQSNRNAPDVAELATEYLQTCNPEEPSREP